MNYANHNLRTDLQEWKNRLYRANWQQFGNQLKYLLNNIENNSQLKGLIYEITLIHEYTNSQFQELFVKSRRIRFEQDSSFDSEAHQAAYCYQFLNHLIKEHGGYDIHKLLMFTSKSDREQEKIIEDYISPIIYYLHDKLDKSNSTIFLLEKYKKRTEWFTKTDLLNRYNKATENYEQILEDDLRLFLFDQGIDYPFSTPSSPSGRSDVIGNIDTNNPLIIEIKIFDRNKQYGKNRIKSGFSQIVKYSNDFTKDVGYLVIYNMDKVELNLSFSKSNNIFPPCIHFNNKIFYFIIINVGKFESASKLGKTQEVVITEEELTDEV